VDFKRPSKTVDSAGRGRQGVCNTVTDFRKVQTHPNVWAHGMWIRFGSSSCMQLRSRFCGRRLSISPSFRSLYVFLFPAALYVSVHNSHARWRRTSREPDFTSAGGLPSRQKRAPGLLSVYAFRIRFPCHYLRDELASDAIHAKCIS
jgi:hypothetical protein